MLKQLFKTDEKIIGDYMEGALEATRAKKTSIKYVYDENEKRAVFEATFK